MTSPVHAGADAPAAVLPETAPEDAAASTPRTAGSLRRGGTATRDLINIGIFSAIYFVVTTIGGMIGILSPIAMFGGFVLGILVNGSVIMLFLARTHARWSLATMGAVTGLLMVVTGHVWYILPACVLLGAGADLIVRAGRYRSRVADIAAYAVFTLWMVVPFLPIFYQADAYFADTAKSMGQAYADALQALVTPWLLVGWTVVLAVVGAIAAWIGTKMLDKHFVKAGIV